MQGQREKRAFERMNIEHELEFSADDGDGTEKGELSDLSAVGIRFVSSRELAPQTGLNITIRGDGDARPVRATAVVLRCTPVEDRYLIACRLDPVD